MWEACLSYLRGVLPISSVKRLLPVVIIFIVVTGIVVHFAGSPAVPQKRATQVIVLRRKHKLLLLDDSNNVMGTYSVAIGRGGVRQNHIKVTRSPEGLDPGYEPGLRPSPMLTR